MDAVAAVLLLVADALIPRMELGGSAAAHHVPLLPCERAYFKVPTPWVPGPGIA